jgi:acyl-coenzyme A thioesterase 13
METLNRLEQLQQSVGREFALSPSPFTHWLKPVVVSADEGRIALAYVIRHDMTNPAGTLHGGVIAAIMDDIIGASVFSLNETEFFTTINNVVDYFSAAREGDTVIARTEMIKRGKQFINAQCEIWNEAGTRLIARGYSNLFKTNVKL